MTTTYYQHEQSGDIATLEDWQADYDCMDIESWFGLPVDECDPGDWIHGGGLIEVEIEFQETDQDWDNETTLYWFEIDGESYAIEDCNSEIHLLDSNRNRIHNDNILSVLKPLYQKEI